MNTHRCTGCRNAIEPGALIYQLTRGRYFKGWETPTYSWSPIREWHFTCFDSDFPLKAQIEPYTCSVCGTEFDSTSDVVYITKGYRPQLGYIRPEQRGHTLPFIAHYACFSAQYPDL